MRQIVAGRDQEVAEWICDRVPELELSTPYTAIGLAKDGELIGGVLYDTYTRINIDMHAAGVPGKRWLSPYSMGEIFRYPFRQLGVKRVTARVRAKNAVARKLVEQAGFVLEGVVRQALPGGEDCCIYGMLREECRWLRAGIHG